MNRFQPLFLGLAVIATGCSNGAMTSPYHPTSKRDAGGDPTMQGGDDMGPDPSTDLGPPGDDLGPNPDLPPADHDPKLHTGWPTFGATNVNTITKMELWTVVWKGDEALGAQVNKFATWMMGSDYWKVGMLEYGVLPGKSMGVLVVPVAPPATFTDSNVATLLNKYLGTTGWPTPNDNTVISFVLNPKTVSSNFGGEGCKDYGGYHSMTSTGIPYLINVQCPDPTTMMPSFDDLTVVLSHEAAEAASDPSGGQNSVNGVPGGGEIGDLCLELNASLKSTAGDTYLVQRIYSNAVALAGIANPCLPDDGPFFGASLDSGDKQNPSQIIVNRSASGKGSAMFKVDTFAFGDVGPIGFAFLGDLLPDGITFSPDYKRGQDMMGNVTGTKGYGWARTTFPVTVNVDATVQAGDYSALLFSTTSTHRLDVFWATISVQ